MKVSFWGILLFIFTIGRVSAADVIFENYTEDTTRGWRHVSKAFAKALMTHERKKQDLTGYEQLDEIPRDPSTRLVWKAVPVSLGGEKIMYVRPTLDPYFAPFYGTHQFQHWLVLNGQILYEGSSDIFQILGAEHSGMRVLAETECTAITCYTTQFLFNPKTQHFEAGACSSTRISDGTNLGDCKKPD